MRKFLEQIGSIPYLVLGIALCATGINALIYLTNNIWPIDVERLDLVRQIANDTVNAAVLLDSVYWEVILAFLSSLALAISGAMLPLAFVFNRRLFQRYPSPLTVIRQSVWVGLWAAFCAWLQMNRSFTIAAAFLVAIIFVMLEIMFQIRARTAETGRAPAPRPIIPEPLDPQDEDESLFDPTESAESQS